MTVKKIQKNLSTTLQNTEKTLGGLERALDNNVRESSEANNGLPEGWIFTTIDTYIDSMIGGASPRVSDYDSCGVLALNKGDIKQQGIVKIKAVSKRVPSLYADKYSGKVVDSGAVLVTLRDLSQKADFLGLIGRFKSDESALITQGMYSLNIPAQLSSDLLIHYSNSPLYREAVKDVKVGVTQVHLRNAQFLGIEIPLPPLAEQTVIAQALDTLLAQVDNIKTRLDAIPKILKTFRQSVLAAAVSGKLTEEWRGENECERSFKTLGEAGVNVKTGPFGSALHKADYIEGGVPVINPMHINDGVISPSNSMTVKDEKYEDLKAWHLKSGDVIVGRRGEMGRAAVFKSDDKMLCGTGSMVLRGDENISSEYLCIILRSPTAIAYFVQGSVGSTMVNLNQKIIKALDVYFPPIEEQTQIVRRVEELFAFADQIEQQVKNAQGRVNNLTQSILAKAFRGEITAQWRADNLDLISDENSAEALLAKIQEERDALKQKAKPKKKTALKKAVNKK